MLADLETWLATWYRLLFVGPQTVLWIALVPGFIRSRLQRFRRVTYIGPLVARFLDSRWVTRAEVASRIVLGAFIVTSLLLAPILVMKGKNAETIRLTEQIRERDSMIAEKNRKIAELEQRVGRSDPRRAEYRRRLIGIHQQSLRAIQDSEDNWRAQITSLTTEQARHPADDPNQKHWQEEIERMKRERYRVIFDPIYRSALQLFDDIKADPLVDTTRARKLLDATRLRIDRPNPHPRPEDVRTFADEIQNLAEKLR